jgi:hypothetical protein
MGMERILVRGFLIDVDVPSEERLMMHIDLSSLPGYKHVDWVSSLQDLLRRIDTEFREKVGKNSTVAPKRSVRVRYVKGEDGVQRKVAAFHPYPSMLINRLKTIRHDVYALLNRSCLVLQEEKIGRMKRKLYFLPSSLAPELMVEIEGANARLEQLKLHIAEFEETDSYRSIMDHVAKALETGVEPPRADLGAIKVSPVPLSLSKRFFADFLEEEERKALLEIDERKREGLAALEREIERRRQEMIEALRKGLQERFAAIVASAEEAVKKAVGRRVKARVAAKQFKDLMNLIEGIGVEFDRDPLMALSNVLSAVGLGDSSAIKSAVSELAESLGVQPSGDPVRDMELASRVARGKPLMLLTID